MMNLAANTAVCYTVFKTLIYKQNSRQPRNYETFHLNRSGVIARMVLHRCTRFS